MNTVAAVSAPQLAFIGRQPIYDRQLQVLGYELLFRRSAGAEHANVVDGDACTAMVLVSAFLEAGLDNVVGPARAFVNVDRWFLLSDHLYSLPMHRVVLEVLETVMPDPEVMKRLRQLKAVGYTIALDDLIYRDELAPFLEVASIAKIDVTQVTGEKLLADVGLLRSRGLTLLAERVETRAEMAAHRAAGFDLFQGHFLARASTLQTRRAPNGDKLAALEVLRVLSSPTASIDELERAVGRDVTLSYRMFRALNSAASGLAGRVDSLHQAIIYLGRSRIRSWVSLLVLSGMSDQPPDVLAIALIRARMCERLGELGGEGEPHAYFTAGLFSLLDVVMGVPMATLLEELPLSSEIEAALISRTGRVGKALEAAIAYERCEWTAVGFEGLPATQVRDAYLDALNWSAALQRTVAA